MSEHQDPEPGSIAWTDLTVPQAETLRDFYSKVVGWTVSNVSMGDYEDYGMHAQPSGAMVAGICHARGVNADLPPQWLVYIIVKDLDAAAQRCRESGGTVIVEPKGLGSHGRYCVIRDPAGAVAALFTPGTSQGEGAATQSSDH
jgi:predicted enzyme related to lactoylglutathione lyase